MPEPMPQEWTDAYRYCSLDPLFVDKGDRRDAVKQYVKVVAMLDDNEKDEIYQSVKDYAADWVKIQQPNQRVEDFKGFVQERLPLIGRSTCLSQVSGSTEFAEAISALKGTLNQLTFKVRRETTQNAGGTVTIAVSILEEPKKDADEAILFALAHEFGHSADLTLNPYNPQDRSFSTVHQAMMPQLPSTTSKNQRLEYFADAFATIFLVSAAGVDRKKIPDAAKFLFAAEAGGGDHPPGEARMIKVRECLEQKC